MRQPIACTDQGSIYKRYGPNDWRVVHLSDNLNFASLPAEDIIYYMDGTKNNGLLLRGNTFGDFGDRPIWSEDGGETWQYPHDYRTVNYLDRQFNWGACGGGGFDYIKDADGGIYGISNYVGAIGDRYLHKGTDFKATDWEEVTNWHLVSDNNTSAFTAKYIADGYIWWTRTSISLGVDDRNLHRNNLDGSNHQVFSVGFQNDENFLWTKGSLHASHRLVKFDTFSTIDFCSIDITDPDNPVITARKRNGVDAEFGENQNLDFDVYFQHMQPVTNQIILAMTHTGTVWDATRDPYGSMWRSEDAGQSWSEVIPLTVYLSHGGFLNEFNAIQVDPDNTNRVVCGLYPPYVFISEDAGLTWTMEVVPLDAVDINNDESNKEWTAFAWGGPSVTGFPGIARVPKLGTTQDLFVRTSP